MFSSEKINNLSGHLPRWKSFSNSFLSLHLLLQQEKAIFDIFVWRGFEMVDTCIFSEFLESHGEELTKKDCPSRQIVDIPFGELLSLCRNYMYTTFTSVSFPTQCSC